MGFSLIREVLALLNQSTDVLIPKKKMLQICSTSEAGNVNICDMLE